MKHKILFLAANPRDTDQLALQEECAAIQRELRMASSRDDFDFCSRWAVGVDDLMRHLNELSPTILHFSGHGTSGTITGARVHSALQRDIEAPRGAGILLQEGGRAQYVSERALAGMIETASPSTRLVVLNACYSAAIADSLCQSMECVVGIDGALEDTAAHSFAVAFYRALGHRRSVGNAVKQAAAILDARQQPYHLLACRTRDGLHADEIFLGSPDNGSRPAGVGKGTAGIGPAGPSKRRGPGTTLAEGYDLFLAHPSANRSSADGLYKLLQPHIRVFHAGRSLQPGEGWDQEILAAQHASRATVLMISRQSDAAWYLSDEVITAIGLHQASPDAHRLVPVLLEPGIVMPCDVRRVATIDAAAVGGLEGVAVRLRDQVEHTRREPAPSLVALKPTSAGRPHRDHFQLYDRLCRLNDTTFEQIVTNAGIDRAELAPRTAALAERALDVAQLAALDPALARRISVELDRRAPWTRS